jgi:Methyltransferase domain
MSSVVRRLARRMLGTSAAAAPSPIPVADDPADLLPGLYDGSIRLAHCRWRFGHVYNDQALVFLCHLAARGAAPIVEFGTFDGRTTYNLALNLPQGQVITVDANVPADLSNVERRAYGRFVPGEHFLDAEQEIRERIVFLQSDSRAVDLSPWYGRAGLVIVDGGHAEDVCANDTALALKLVRRGGVVVWDDYTPYWPGVKSTLDALAGRLSLTSFPRLGLVVHVSGK